MLWLQPCYGSPCCRLCSTPHAATAKQWLWYRSFQFIMQGMLSSVWPCLLGPAGACGLDSPFWLGNESRLILAAPSVVSRSTLGGLTPPGPGSFAAGHTPHMLTFVTPSPTGAPAAPPMMQHKGELASGVLYRQQAKHARGAKCNQLGHAWHSSTCIFGAHCCCHSACIGNSTTCCMLCLLRHDPAHALPCDTLWSVLAFL